MLSEQYAITIASDWNVDAGGIGYVTRFQVETEHARRYPSQRAGGKEILELWVPAEELADFNAHLVGPIEVMHEFRSEKRRYGLARRMSLNSSLKMMKIVRTGIGLDRTPDRN